MKMRKLLTSSSVVILLALAGCASLQPELRPVETAIDDEALRAGDLRLAESALRSGDIQVAYSLYRELSQSYPDNKEVWLGLGDTYYLDNELEQAQQAYQRAEAIDPSDTEAKLSLARIAIRMRDFGHAEQKLNAILAQQPTHPFALASLGVVYDLTNRAAQAQETYRKGLQANPGN